MTNIETNEWFWFFFFNFLRQGVSPLYVGLNPSPYHLVTALQHLLSSNDWFPFTLIIDDSLYAQSIRQAIHPVAMADLFSKVINQPHQH